MFNINTNSLIFKVLDKPLRAYLLVMFSATFVLWGTGWELIGLTPSYLWVGISCFICLFFNKENIEKNVLLIIGIMLFLLLIYTVIGLPKVLSSDDPTRDINYLIGYDIRFVFGVLTFFVLINLIKRESDFDLVVFCILILFILLSLYLTWKYLFVFQVEYVGVLIEGGPSYAGKNSLGTALALIFPFFVPGLFRRKFLMFLSLVGLVTLIIFAVNLFSRSVLIILGVEILSLMYFTKSKALKRATGFLSLILALVILIAGVSLYDWVRKSGDFASSFKDIEGAQEPFSETQRAWLVFEGLRGFISSSGLGNGVATFRIRSTNEGSRTETHNDYILLLYEQGIIGVSLLLLLFYSRIRKTINIVSYTGNRYAEASLASLFGLVVAILFINMLNTMVFWSLLAINYSLLEIIRKHEEDNKYQAKNIDQFPKNNKRSLI